MFCSLCKKALILGVCGCVGVALVKRVDLPSPSSFGNLGAVVSTASSTAGSGGTGVISSPRVVITAIENNMTEDTYLVPQVPHRPLYAEHAPPASIRYFFNLKPIDRSKT